MLQICHMSRVTVLGPFTRRCHKLWWRKTMWRVWQSEFDPGIVANASHGWCWDSPNFTTTELFLKGKVSLDYVHSGLSTCWISTLSYILWNKILLIPVWMRSVFFLEKRSFCAKEIFHGWDVTVVETQCETVLVGKEMKESCLQLERFVFFFDIFRTKG